MIKKSLFLFICLYSLIGFSQEISVQEEDSYKTLVKNLYNSKELKYNDVLQRYNQYIESHPKDVMVKLYKCKFIGTAFYDEYEEYNLKYDETEACINNLYKQHREHPEVILYKLDNLYGEEREALLDSTFDFYKSNKSLWTYPQRSRLYEISANYHIDDNHKAISDAKQAEKFSDSLDMSLIISRAYINLNQKGQARENILSNLYYDGDSWTLAQKGELLIELDEDIEALKMFDRAKVKDTSYSNNDGLYKIFLKKENYDQARTFIVADTLNAWNKLAGYQKLLKHDMLYSGSDMALLSLRRMQEESYYDDFFAIKRLRIFFKSPLKLWNFTELSHLFILVTFILVLFLVPYLWILPIYGVSNYFNLGKAKAEASMPVDWSLKDFWLISFIYLFAQIAIIFVFYYEDYMNTYFDIVYTYANEDTFAENVITAKSIILFSVILFLFTFILLNKKRLNFVVSSILSVRQIIGFAVLFVILNTIILNVLSIFIELPDTANFIKTLSAREDIQALMTEYGFAFSVLIVAAIVPFYEEIMFRGIILSSVEKHLGFKSANVIQSILFATVHLSLSLFIFYFIFGMITGYTAKKTKGLLAGIVLHALNNLFALIGIYALAKVLL